MAAPPTVNALLDRKSKQIQERLSKVITEFLAARCPVFRDKVMSSMGVYPQDEIGRDLKIIKVFQNPVAGVFESDRGRNEFGLYGDKTTIVAPKFHTQQVVETFPDPLSGPNPNPFRLGLWLKGFVANLALTIGELDAEANPNYIGQIVAPKMLAFANNIARHIENYWWLSQNKDYRLCALSAVSAVTSTTVGTQTYYTFTAQPDNLATYRFGVGDRIDFYKSDGSDRYNDTANPAASQTFATRLEAWVAAVDPMTNTVTFASDTDPATWDGVASNTRPPDGALVVYANSKIGSSTVKGLAGINSWLKFGSGGDDDYILGAERDTSNEINVHTHPEFKSYSKAVNGVLTESKLQRYFAMAEAAMEMWGHSIDTVCCSFGIVQRYLEEKVSQFIIQRPASGAPISLEREGQTGDLTITVNGKKYTLYHSMCIEAQTVYGFKAKNNWKMIVPPSGKGMSRFDKLETGIPFEFVGPVLTGTGSLKLPIYDTSGARSLATTGIQMPGRCRMQWVPEQTSGLKLTGVTESREYSDESNN